MTTRTRPILSSVLLPVAASATVNVAAATLIDGTEPDALSGKSDESGKDFWTTSVGKFKFCIEELPPAIQFTYQLLKVPAYLLTASE